MNDRRNKLSDQGIGTTVRSEIHAYDQLNHFVGSSENHTKAAQNFVLVLDRRSKNQMAHLWSKQ